MLSELQTLQKSAAQLPSQAQAGFQGLSERVGAVAGEVNSILRSEGPISDKLGKLKEAVETPSTTPSCERFVNCQ